ncbi:MAG: DNA-processing protein DprA [bacterium]
MFNRIKQPSNLAPDERKYWIAWSAIPGIGPGTFKLLNDYFQLMAKAWHCSIDQLSRLGLNKPTLKQINLIRPTFNPDDFLERLAQLQIKTLLLPDNDYPELLRQSPAPPSVLYLKGQLPAGPCLSVVGTRIPSNLGATITDRLIKPLASQGIIIISGLALGIDAAAHQATLDASGRTIAVFASGVDHIYPSTNQYLAESIIEQGGGWLSEYPPQTQPLSYQFPLRNRIIAGLSAGTLVIEAGQKSGALITARYALEANREVMAVPGSITNPQAMGTNYLIKEGAAVITDPQDVLNALQITVHKPNSSFSRQALTDRERQILQLFSSDPIHVDQVIEKSKINSNQIIAMCTHLEVKGYLRNIGNSKYILN